MVWGICTFESCITCSPSRVLLKLKSTTAGLAKTRILAVGKADCPSKKHRFPLKRNLSFILSEIYYHEKNFNDEVRTQEAGDSIEQRASSKRTLWETWLPACVIPTSYRLYRNYTRISKELPDLQRHSGNWTDGLESRNNTTWVIYYGY